MTYVIVDESSHNVFTFRTRELDPSGVVTFALYILKTPDLRYIITLTHAISTTHGMG